MSKMDDRKLLSYKSDSLKLLTLYRKIKDLSDEESELLAKELCEDIEDKFNEVPIIIRAYKDNKNPKGYRKVDYREKNSSRVGKPIKPEYDKKMQETGEHTRNEDYIAMSFFEKYNCSTGCKEKELGYVLDYQTPIGGNLNYLDSGKRIQDPDSDEEVNYCPGCCDLMSYNSDENLIYIIELKDEDSKEPLISPVIEAYTYYRLFDKSSLRNNMKKIYPDIGIDDDTKFVPVLLIYENGTQHESIANKKLYELITRLGERVLIYSGVGNHREIKRII